MGTSQTVEVELAQGYTHCFLVTFKDKAGLETYSPTLPTKPSLAW